MMECPNTAAALAALIILCTPMAADAGQAAADQGADHGADRGAALYEQRCTGCHSLDANRVGPSHRGVVGRKAGSVAGFAYSPAVKAADLVWTEDNLDRWLTDPQAVIPGQRMNVRIGDAAVRAAIIAFLKRQSP